MPSLFNKFVFIERNNNVSYNYTDKNVSDKNVSKDEVYVCR